MRRGFPVRAAMTRTREEQIGRFAERQKQIGLAKRRGEAHTGASSPA